MFYTRIACRKILSSTLCYTPDTRPPLESKPSTSRSKLNKILRCEKNIYINGGRYILFMSVMQNWWVNSQRAQNPLDWCSPETQCVVVKRRNSKCLSLPSDHFLFSGTQQLFPFFPSPHMTSEPQWNPQREQGISEGRMWLGAEPGQFINMEGGRGGELWLTGNPLC